LRDGGYHYEWRIAKIDGDNVLVLGHAKPIRRTSRYFHLAIWGPVIVPPPAEDGGGSTSALAKSLFQKPYAACFGRCPLNRKR
jgi:hypothetical protein